MENLEDDKNVLNNDNLTKDSTVTEENTADAVKTNMISEINGDTVKLDNIENNASVEDNSINEARNNAKWYVLHTFSGYENVAKENLETVTNKYNLQERIFDIVIPMEDVVEEKNGKRKVVSRKVMPGYILVKMIYGDDIWHAVTRTRGITGFVGPKGRPLPLTEEEIRKMRLEKITVINVDLTANDKVEVLEGPLNSFVGTVISVDAQSSKCRVMVEMFGRETPVDLSLSQVRKID